MSTERRVRLELLLPSYDPFKKLLLNPFPAPVAVLTRKCEQVRDDKEDDNEEDEDDEFYYDGWTHATPELIEYRVRGYNDEIEFLELELAAARELYSHASIRLKIQHCMEERDALIVEHTYFYPERRHNLKKARESRISKDPTPVILAYEERFDNCGLRREAERELENALKDKPSPGAGSPTATNSGSCPKQRNRSKSRPISLKVEYRKNSLVCTFTAGTKRTKP
jgi:hypothetical protein